MKDKSPYQLPNFDFSGLYPETMKSFHISADEIFRMMNIRRKQKLRKEKINRIFNENKESI